MSNVHRYNVCVFCGSHPGNLPGVAREAQHLAEGLCKRQFGLVYGGAHVGIMGLMADTVLKNGGHVTGVIPKTLVDKEVAHHGIQDLRIVGSMHERKQAMYDLSGAFVVLPGGFGTLDELFEVLTWIQIGLHKKPVYLLNVDGFFDHLLTYLDSAVSAGFIKPEHRSQLKSYPTAQAVLDHLVKN